MVAAKEAYRRVEEENGRLTDERLFLLVELGATKDDFTTFQEKSFAKRSALEADFDASNDVILTTVIAIMPLRTISMGASLRSLLGWRIHLPL